MFANVFLSIFSTSVQTCIYFILHRLVVDWPCLFCKLLDVCYGTVERKKYFTQMMMYNKTITLSVCMAISKYMASSRLVALCIIVWEGCYMVREYLGIT